ncbi:MAG: STN domain-containing protein [Armatimonadota bacterium]|nr:hypothetical protein [bacterium]
MLKIGMAGFALMAVAVILTAPVTLYAQGDTPAQVNASTVNLELKNVPIDEGIAALFEGRGLKYQILPGVSGRIVELKLRGVTFEQALKALTDAAELTYTVKDGVYVINPVKQSKPIKAVPVAVSGTKPSAVQPQAAQPPAAEIAEAPAAQPAPQGNSQNQVFVNQQAPVYYGQQGGGIPAYGYPPPYYQAGNLRFMYGWPPVTFAGSDTYVMNYGPGFPPPPGWVSPEALRFLRGSYATRAQPYFTPSY